MANHLADGIVFSMKPKRMPSSAARLSVDKSTSILAQAIRSVSVVCVSFVQAKVRREATFSKCLQCVHDTISI
eukprot:12575663-Prorocentrum_lima.AAC.1